MADSWTRIVMKGRSQVIPAVCPNCLASADRPIRYGYKGVEGWLTRTTYYQTFLYCAECHPQAASGAGLRLWGYLSIAVGLVAFLPLLMGLFSLARDPVSGRVSDAADGTLSAVAAVLALLTGVLFYSVARSLKRRRHPRRPEQAVWGPAAYYTGGAWLGTRSGTAGYKAARPEWIAALARSNPDQVEASTYQALTGAEPPPPAAEERPFGSA